MSHSHSVLVVPATNQPRPPGLIDYILMTLRSAVLQRFRGRFGTEDGDQGDCPSRTAQTSVPYRTSLHRNFPGDRRLDPTPSIPTLSSPPLLRPRQWLTGGSPSGWGAAPVYAPCNFPLGLLSTPLLPQAPLTTLGGTPSLYLFRLTSFHPPLTLGRKPGGVGLVGSLSHRTPVF